MFKKSVLAACAALMLSGAANAALVLTVQGISGTGVTHWTLSGSSQAISAGTIRTGVGSTTFDVADSFEPNFTGNFLANSSIQDRLFSVTGAASISIGAQTRSITTIYLDDDGALRDDIGIRVSTQLPFASGELSSWTGNFTVGLDINSFNLGTYRLNSSQANGGGFVFAGVNDVILNVAQGRGTVPEPASLALVAVALGLLGASRRAKTQA